MPKMFFLFNWKRVTTIAILSYLICVTHGDSPVYLKAAAVKGHYSYNRDNTTICKAAKLMVRVR